MKDVEQLVRYLQQGIDDLLNRGYFRNPNRTRFRKTQKLALEAYKGFLNSNGLTPEERLKGFFEIPTGIGKTAIFVGIVSEAHRVSEANSDVLHTMIVVPKTNLLEQTKNEAFHKFAPEIEDRVGLYGGTHRQLNKPITIITYESWSKLVEEGRLGPHNVDILISDEAHRGTSEVRIKLSKAFNNGTHQLAFTATAHFDETKSVQQTHHREIFYKGLPDAVREGELAAYIGTQFYIIRVDPPWDEDLIEEGGDEELEEDLGDTFEETANNAEKFSGQYKRKLRQKAWNQRAVIIFRDGRDDITKDPLSDNQAGFFVDSIAQAKNLKILLNADPVLSQIAKKRGCDDVAVTIHSRMPHNKQRILMAAYKEGKYMAVIGDEKFKEGFDHPPLKTIIDYPHGSLVDKAQILGRGARKWRNDAKRRYEGLTFVDTIVYIGSRDPQKDKRLESAALRRAQTVFDILEGTYVLGPEKKQKPSKPTPPSPGLFLDDENVKEFATLDRTYVIESEIDKAKQEGWIEYTMEDILESARLEYTTTNRRPTCTDGNIAYGPLNGKTTWMAVNFAITAGFLKGTACNSLAHLLNENLIGRYTIEDVIESAKKCCEKTGQRPFKNDGEIAYGPLAQKTTWDNVNYALQKGFLKEEGYTSLADLLDKNNMGIEAQYSIEDVIKSARQQLQATGRRPSVIDGEVAYGPLAGKTTWQIAHSRIKRGCLKKCGYLSLADALDKNGINVKSQYSFKDVIESARLEFKVTGKRPTNTDSKKIGYGRLKGKSTWKSVDYAIRIGFLKDQGYASLADALDKNGIGAKYQYTLEDVIESARLQLEETGQWPSNRHPKIIHGPLANNTTWFAVNNKIRNGAFKDCGYKSLDQFLKANNIGNDQDSKVSAPTLAK